MSMATLTHHRAGDDAYVEAHLLAALAKLSTEGIRPPERRLRAPVLVVDVETVGHVKRNGRLPPIVVDFGWAVVEVDGRVERHGSFLTPWLPESVAAYATDPEALWITSAAAGAGYDWAEFVTDDPEIAGGNAARIYGAMLGADGGWTAFNAEFDHRALCNTLPFGWCPKPKFCMMRDLAGPIIAQRWPHEIPPPSKRAPAHVWREWRAVGEPLQRRGSLSRADAKRLANAGKWLSAEEAIAILNRNGHPCLGWNG